MTLTVLRQIIIDAFVVVKPKTMNMNLKGEVIKRAFVCRAKRKSFLKIYVGLMTECCE